MASAEREPVAGVWGKAHGQEVRGQSPLKPMAFLGDRLQNSSPYPIGPLSVCLPVLSVCPVCR